MKGIEQFYLFRNHRSQTTHPPPPPPPPVPVPRFLTRYRLVQFDSSLYCFIHWIAVALDCIGFHLYIVGPDLSIFVEANTKSFTQNSITISNKNHKNLMFLHKFVKFQELGVYLLVLAGFLLILIRFFQPFKILIHCRAQKVHRPKFHFFFQNFYNLS